MAMQLMRRNPFLRECEMLQRRMDQLFGDLFQSTPGVPAKEDERWEWVPVADVFEDSDHFLITLDLPEMDLKDIELGIEDSLLTIKGERKLGKEDQKGNYHRIERDHGTFHRSFTLPATVDQDKVSAQYDRGILKIALPKKEETKPRRVTIEAR